LESVINTLNSAITHLEGAPQANTTADAAAQLTGFFGQVFQALASVEISIVKVSRGLTSIAR
jgi:hypothetical protein